MSVDNERRSAGGQRVAVKTLVEISAGAGGSAAFEAESVDMTLKGMHLRTAYLPELGEPLVCRFETDGAEVVVQGEVVWRKEENYGGDFGVRFLQIDQDSLDALRLILKKNQPAAPSASTQETEDNMRRGTRVRLHIDGLGSPMKARVREAQPAEVKVSSKLEFLKVGRPVDLENVDARENRPARIERVGIEMEPQSQVPQLTVALRYTDGPSERPTRPAMPRASEVKATRPSQPPEETRLASDESKAERDESIEDEDVSAGSSLWNRVKEMGPALATLGDKARSLGGRAKDIMNQAVDKARTSKDKAPAPAPRRTTSSIPVGAIRSDGRRVQKPIEREVELEEEEINTSPMNKLPKRAAIIGAAGVILAVVALSFAHKSSKPTDTASAADSASAALEQVAAAPSAADPNAPALGAPVAHVPLFGPTPMGTALPQQAAQPAAQPAVAAVTPPPSEFAQTAHPTPLPGADEEEDPIPTANKAQDKGHDKALAADDSGDDEGDGDKADKKDSHKKSTKEPKIFSRGKVKDATVMTLEMNGTIDGLHGASTATGFTVEVVGAKSKEPAARLKRQDGRIASAQIINKDESADLTIKFRDGVPAYRVEAKGSTLRILIGSEKKTAKAGKHHHR